MEMTYRYGHAVATARKAWGGRLLVTVMVLAPAGTLAADRIARRGRDKSGIAV